MDGSLESLCRVLVKQQCKLHRATCRRFDTILVSDGQTDRQTELL